MGVMLSALTGFQVWGGSIGDILQEWSYLGIFDYVLPFLLIFAVVFGILFTARIFGENRGIITVIALAVALLALQFDYIPRFFSIIFPYTGIGIAILLVALILMGLFIDPENQGGYRIAFFIIGGLITLIVVFSALTSYEWWGGYWWDQYYPSIIALLVIGALVAAVIAGTSGESGKGVWVGTKKKP